MITKDTFAENLQKVLADHNLKTSKENAWKVFKSMVNDVIVKGVIDDGDNKISLAGIGNFEMLKAAARGTKEGVVDFVPKLRWRPSSKIDLHLEEATGQVPDPKKRAAKRAELEKAGKLKSNLPVRTKKADATAAPATKADATAAPATKADAKTEKKADKGDEIDEEF